MLLCAYKMQRKKRLAIIGVGMLGAGSLDQGIPAMVNGLIELQSREKYSITVYSFIPIDRNRSPGGIRVRCISSMRISLKIKYAILVFQFVVDHLINNFDLIHAQSPYPAGVMASWANRFFKIPWILSLHAGETIALPDVSYGDLLVPRLKKAAFEVCPRADILLTLTRFQADITKKNMMLERDIEILNRGVEVSDYATKSLVYPVRFIHISNYHPIKDYETLLKTFSVLVNQIPCELIIAGDNYDASFEKLITAMGLDGSVKRMGSVPNVSLAALFDTAHILLHTSIYESQAMVVLEAMAHGVVVCGTHVGIMADLADKYCLTVPPKQSDLLADKIVELVKNELRYQEIRRDAYLWVQEHDLKWHVNELEKLYSRVTHERF